MSLDVYVPEPRVIEAGGKTLQILPLKVRQIPAFARHITPVVGPLLSGEFLEAMAVGGEDLVQAVRVATGEPEAWLADLYPQDFLVIVAAVVEVNADFFAQRVLPALDLAVENTRKILGATRLPSSLPAATAMATASTTPLDS